MLWIAYLLVSRLASVMGGLFPAGLAPVRRQASFNIQYFGEKYADSFFGFRGSW